MVVSSLFNFDNVLSGRAQPVRVVAISGFHRSSSWARVCAYLKDMHVQGIEQTPLALAFRSASPELAAGCLDGRLVTVSRWTRHLGLTGVSLVQSCPATGERGHGCNQKHSCSIVNQAGCD